MTDEVFVIDFDVMLQDELEDVLLQEDGVGVAVTVADANVVVEVLICSL